MQKVDVYLLECYYRYPNWEGARQTSGFPINQEIGYLQKRLEMLQNVWSDNKLVCGLWNWIGFPHYLEKWTGCPVRKQPVWRWWSALKRKGSTEKLRWQRWCYSCRYSEECDSEFPKPSGCGRIWSGSKHWETSESCWRGCQHCNVVT